MKPMHRHRWEPAMDALVPLLVAAGVVVSLLLGLRYALLDTTPVDQPATDDRVERADESSAAQAAPSRSDADDSREQHFAQLRARMVAKQLIPRGIDDESVLKAMRKVPRHKFVPEPRRDQAYRDSPLPIGHKQTISQPLIVAMMTQLAQPHAQSKALDIGTGSGYQAAILSELVEKVYSIEILESLANESRQRLRALGYENIEVRCGDGYRGWAQQAPFDVIIVAAAPDHVPQPLIKQLAVGGRLVIPVGGRFMQRLLVIEKQSDGTVRRRNVTPVSFVPMTGEAEDD